MMAFCSDVDDLQVFLDDNEENLKEMGSTP